MSRRTARSPLAALTAVAVGVGLVGCGSTGPAPQWREGSTGPTAVTSGTATAPHAPREVRLAFAGDVHFTGRTLGLLDDPATTFGPIASTLRDADVTLLNLETSVTDRGTPQPKTYQFRAPRTAFAALRAAGVDAVSIANNHILDYGRQGLSDTLDAAAEARYPVFGAGRDADAAYAPWLTTVRGLRIAVLGMSQVHDLAESWRATDIRSGVAMAFDPARATAAVRAARKQADLVVVFMHWGVEGNSCATVEMKTFAQRLSGAGADIVVGAHAHTLLANGWLGQTYVHYGLGNFLWYSTSHSTDSGVLKLVVRDRTVVESRFVPATVSGSGQPVPATGADKRRILDKLAAAQGCTGLSARRPG
ncbi:poly-gamma-glutamate synthesis protein (capsule biosynthesis protein) [Micromonospora sediminicola]|uniref:Poly-gamma-glutamate synthesis protein (Capsule biosynthesis protein) n=1 Tax=Micromonospora sediminicola TaxID=946078 RepID=A0A1A9BA30_9ACTN|nr:CapA family protein [Micromonospora sediminicola]SBT65757.1 poly-gamma-glutamate synthesis protein (capsule biosynthesis protein) [Micromonospora sediminicola]